MNKKELKKYIIELFNSSREDAILGGKILFDNFDKEKVRKEFDWVRINTNHKLAMGKDLTNFVYLGYMIIYTHDDNHILLRDVAPNAVNDFITF